MAKSKQENDAIFERLVCLRKNSPSRFAFCVIGAAWDDLNSEFQAHGISEAFALKRKSLKTKIRLYIDEKGVITKDDLNEFCENHPDHFDANGKKFIHGYNFNYNK